MTIYRITHSNDSAQVVTNHAGIVYAAVGFATHTRGWKISKLKQHCKDHGWAITMEIGQQRHIDNLMSRGGVE